MHPSRNLFAVGVLLIGASAIAAFAQSSPATIETRWADLNSPDEGKATRALLALAATPKETTAFLQEHLKPVKADPKRVEQLLKALASDTFVVRQQAIMELEYYGKYIKADLEAALKGNANLNTRRHIEQLLEKMPKEQKKEPPPAPKLGGGKSISVTNINGQITILVDGQPINMAPAAPVLPPGPPQQWVRATRAVMILEHLATPEARAILQTIANGESDALPTLAAKESLERLKTTP